MVKEVTHAMRQVRDDEPLMIAWRAYAKSEDYQNTFKWAAHDEHRDGSMWGAFMAGFLAAQAMSAGTAKTAKPVEGGARQRGPKDAPEPRTQGEPSTPENNDGG